MCRSLRKTHIRGRSGTPLTRLRILAWRFCLASSPVFFTVASPYRGALGAGLADLAPDPLFDVLDPLALVGLGGADAADVRRDRADEALVDPLDDDLVLARRVDLDPLGDRVGHRVRV